MLVGGLFEFVLGNTFSFVVFCSFGMHPSTWQRSPSSCSKNTNNPHSRLLAFPRRNTRPRLRCHLPLRDRSRCRRGLLQQLWYYTPRPSPRALLLTSALSVLLPLHGPPQLHLPDLLSANERVDGWDIPRAHDRVPAADGGVLERGRGQRRHGCNTPTRRGRHPPSRLRPRLVRLLGCYAALGRLSH